MATSGRSRRGGEGGNRQQNYADSTASSSSDAGAVAALEEVQHHRRLAPEEWVLAALLAVLVVLNFSGIVSRYWIHISLPWIEEVEVALLMYVVFLGAGLTVVRDLHLGFAPVVEQLPRRVGALLRRAGRAAFAAMFIVLLWYGVQMVMAEASYDQRTPTLGWPEWLISLAIPLGASLALVRIGLTAIPRPKR